MSGLGNYYRVVLLVLFAFFIDIRVVSAAKIDDFYVHEFLRITESSAIWQTSKFIQQLNEEVQLLADDGLIPSRYHLTDVDSMIEQLDQGKNLDDSKKYEVVRQYLTALSDLHYGPTFQTYIEPYLIYPEHRQPIKLDANRILNFALLGVDAPSDAFALARPDYVPYLRLRLAFTIAEKYGVLTDDQRLQVQVNLERFRRLSHKVTEQMLLVDIAGAELTLYDGASQPLVRQSSQIGRTDRQTPLMWSEITHITVNPSWTVPPTVYREDMLPQIRQSLSFLEDNQIQVLDFDGRSLNPASINWRNPGRILLRQAPGKLNELGRIVVRFPNNEAIFLHDTPSQGYFSQSMRALSSGCIRLQQAPALAHKLLAASQTDAADRLDALLDSGTTQELFLDQPIPVLLAYWTVEANAEMGLHFRPDIYGLDAPMLNFFKDQAVLAGS